MKKKKILTYVLIVVLLIVWGLVFYKLYRYYFPEKETGAMNSEVSTVDPVPKPSMKKDTFELIDDYRDPFLGKMAGKRRKPKRSVEREVERPKKKKQPERKEQKRFRWPRMLYGGVVRNRSSRVKVALMKINGKDELMHEGDTLMKVKVKNIWDDSVTIAYKGKEKVLRK